MNHFANMLTFVQKQMPNYHSLPISSWTHQLSLDDCVCVLKILVLDKYLTQLGRGAKAVENVWERWGQWCDGLQCLGGEQKPVVQQQWAHSLIWSTPLPLFPHLLIVSFCLFYFRTERGNSQQYWVREHSPYKTVRWNCTQILAWANRQSQTCSEHWHQMWSASNV